MFNSRNKNKVIQYKKYLQFLRKESDPYTTLKIYKNKKKIRNWNTLVKKIDEQKDDHIFSCAEDLLEYLNKYSYLHMKLNIDPWNRLDKRNPPDWYKKLFIFSLIEVYDNWHYFMSKLKLDYSTLETGALIDFLMQTHLNWQQDALTLLTFLEKDKHHILHFSYWMHHFCFNYSVVTKKSFSWALEYQDALKQAFFEETNVEYARLISYAESALSCLIEVECSKQSTRKDDFY